MANDVLIVSAAPQVYVRYVVVLNSQGANSSNITVQTWALIRNGTRYGGWDWNAQISGTSSGSITATFGGDYYMGGRNVVANHDVNGNLSIGVASWIDAYYGSGTASTTYNAPRIPLAPTNIAPVSSLVKVTTARITAGVSSHGHGTSSTYSIRYRLSGTSTWTTRAFGGATWDLTGLQPGKTYEMSSQAKNNNGDTNSFTTGTYTFKTKGIAGLTPLLMALVRG